MSFITLEQHFYGSAPIGLSASRGFQTIARSPGCARHELAEKHCSFFRPGAKNELRPVNWGWLRLADQRVCIHRVAYSGNDELGRPGNFLAHNLIAGPDALDAIDYDIPSLFRWVKERSPYRYPMSGEPDDGFIRSNEQIYQKFGWDVKRLRELPQSERARLATFEPLEISLDDLNPFRQKADTKLWDSLADVRKSGLIDAILVALLADASQRKPILLVGASDGEDQSELERRIVEFLFALLPYHCRKRLTYATYCGLQAGGSLAALPERRLIATTRNNPEFRVGAGDSSTAWVVSGTGKGHKLPSDSSVARMVVQALRNGQFDELRSLRDAASAFDFPEEMEGIAKASKLSVLREQPSPGQFLLFHQVARYARPGQNYLLTTAQRLVANFDSARDDLKNMTTACLATIERLLPAAEQEGGVVEILSTLVGAAFDAKDWATFVEIVTAVGSREKLQPLRQAILDRSFERLLSRAGGCLTARWQQMWKAISEIDAEGDSIRRDLADRTAGCVGSQLLALPFGHRPKLADALTDFVVPVLARLEVATADDLADRLELIRDASPENDEAVGAYLIQSRNNQRLTLGLVQVVAERRSELLLRYYSAWQTFAGSDARAADLLQPAFEKPGLVLKVWTVPSEPIDAPLLRSAQALLEAWEAPALAETRLDLARIVVANPRTILDRFDRDDPTDSPLVLAELGRLHVRFVRMLVDTAENARSKQDRKDLEPLRTDAVQILVRILAFILTRPLATARDSVAILEQPVYLLRTWYAGTEELTRAVVSLADHCRDLNATRERLEPARLDEWQRELRRTYEGKRAPRPISEAESEWLTLHLEPLPRAAELPPDVQTIRIAQLLSIRPELLDQNRGDFERWFSKRLSSPEVWEALVALLKDDLCRTRLRRWFDDEPARKSLLDAIRKRTGTRLRALGESVAKALSERDDQESTTALERLAECGCREFQEPAARADTQRSLAKAIHRFHAARQSNSPDREAYTKAILTWCHRVIECSGSLENRLPPSVEKGFWSCLGEVLSILPLSDVVLFFPRFRAVGAAFAAPNPPSTGDWIELFRPLAHQRDGDNFREVMVAIADALFRPPLPDEPSEPPPSRSSRVAPPAAKWTDEPKRAVAQFDEIRQAWRDPSLAPFFEPDPASGADRFFAAAARLPDLAYQFEPGAQFLLIGRARMLAYFARQAPGTVLEYYVYWARKGKDAAHIYLGCSLCGFLTARGEQSREIVAQANVILLDENWAALSSACQKLVQKDLPPPVPNPARPARGIGYEQLLEDALLQTERCLRDLKHDREAAGAMKSLKKRLGRR